MDLRDVITRYLESERAADSETRIAGVRTLSEAAAAASDAELVQAMRRALELGAKGSGVKREIYRAAERRPAPWIVDLLPELTPHMRGSERATVARLALASGHSALGPRYADLAASCRPLEGFGYSVLVALPPAEILGDEGNFVRIATAAAEARVLGLLAERLAGLLAAGPAPAAVRRAADVLVAGHRDLASRETLTEVSGRTSSAAIAELLARADIECPPASPPPEATSGDVIARIERRMLAAVPLTLAEELALARDLGDLAAEKEAKKQTETHLVDALWRRYRLPFCNHYMLAAWVGLVGFHFNDAHVDKARLVETMRAIVAGYVAADELARAAGIRIGAPVDDPFGFRKSRGSLIPPAQTRFLERAAELSPALYETPIGVWASALADDALERLADSGALREGTRDLAHAGLVRGVTVGALLWTTAHRWKAGPLAPLAEAATAAGLWRKPKRPSVAALEAAHPPRPVALLERVEAQPESAIASCVSTGSAPCPCLDPDEMPRGTDGTPLRFVAQVRLDGAKQLAGIAGGAALVLLFQRGSEAKAMALSAGDLAARATRPVPPGLAALRIGRAAKEPVSPTEAQLLTPDLFAGRQASYDPETLLGRWTEKTNGKLCETSKIGGTYTPVQGTLAHPPGGRLLHLVFQLDVDDGAPLPDAGLTYVLAAEGAEELVVHAEHC